MKTIFFLVFALFSLDLYCSEFSSFNIQYLTGKDYSKNGQQQDLSKKNIITFEHVSAWKYGDNFFFIDLTAPWANASSNNQDIYGEWHSRFSYNKLASSKWSGFIQDISLAAEMNFGRSSIGSNRAILYGIGFDFKVPFFTFFNINVFARDNKDTHIKTIQISPYWLTHFNLGITKWSFGGFLDYETSKNAHEANYLFSPQLLMDIGHLFATANKYYVGVEYNKWSNKFGIKDNNEDRIQLMALWNL